MSSSSLGEMASPASFRPQDDSVPGAISSSSTLPPNGITSSIPPHQSATSTPTFQTDARFPPPDPSIGLPAMAAASSSSSSSQPLSAAVSLQSSPIEARRGALAMASQLPPQQQIHAPHPPLPSSAPHSGLGLQAVTHMGPPAQQPQQQQQPPHLAMAPSSQQAWNIAPLPQQQQHVAPPPPPPPASAPPSVSAHHGIPAAAFPSVTSMPSGPGSIPPAYSMATPQTSASPLLSLSKLEQMTSAMEGAGSAVAAAGRVHARKPSQGQADRRPQLRAITTALPQQAPSGASPQSALQSSRPPQSGLQSAFVQQAVQDDGSKKEAAAISKIGVLLDDVVTLAFNARDLFRKGDHGPSSMCLTELSRSLARIGELGSQSLAEMQEKGQQAQPQQQQQSSMPPPSTVHPPFGQNTSPEQHRGALGQDQSADAEFVDPVLESPGIRKRGINPYDELPMKTMRGQNGTPIEPPAAPPSAPPTIHQDGISLNGGTPLQPTPPTLHHTNSAPLIPQLKTVGPSPLGPAQVQTHAWHDPGSGAVSGPAPGAAGVSPIVTQSEQSFAPGSFMPTAQPSVPHPSMPPSPQAKMGHVRTHSLLDEVFSQKTALNGNNSSPTRAFPHEDDSGWMADSGAQSPEDAWSPSHDMDDPLAHAGAAFQGSGAGAAAVHGQSLKGSIDAPDMPGRGPILPLPVDIQEKLDGLFYQYLRFVCSHNDCADSNGEGIHQTLMPKRMSRLNHSEDFRPFKFRIQAFVNRWQEEVYKSGLTEEHCSPKRLRQYLWTQPYISRFNEDGRKAKSKGNHVWIVEGRKLTDDEWEFQRFERKIVGPAERIATCGMSWSWPLRVWDPQMSAASIKPTFSVTAKPDWLEFNDSEESTEKSLSGTPSAASQGGRVAVSAQCYHSNGTLQHLELAFDLEISSGDLGPVAPVANPSVRNPLAPSLASHPLLQEVAGHPAVQPLGVIPAAGTPAASGYSMSAMHHPNLVARLPPSMIPSTIIPPAASAPLHIPQAQAQGPGSGPARDANQFFGSMNYPFTPPDAFTSQPPFFLPDAQGDSPMPMAVPQQEPPFADVQLAQQQQQAQMPPQQQQQQQQMPPPSAPSQAASPFPQINNIPVIATPAQTGGLEPHDQIQRAQIRAMIDRMQHDQTASLSLQLPERRKSQSVRHQQSQVEQQHSQQLVQQQQQQQQGGVPLGENAGNMGLGSHSISSQAGGPPPHGIEDALSPFSTPMPLAPSAGIPVGMRAATAGQGLSQASLDPVLSPALEIDPFAQLTAFNNVTSQQQQSQVGGDSNGLATEHDNNTTTTSSNSNINNTNSNLA